MADLETLKTEMLASIRRVKERMQQRQALQDADADFCADMTDQLRKMMSVTPKDTPQ